jgi:hypothetical protein
VITPAILSNTEPLCSLWPAAIHGARIFCSFPLRHASPTDLPTEQAKWGKYSTGHAFISAYIEIDRDVTPGMNPMYGLISREFFRCPTDKPYVRHDLRIWPSNGPAARLKNEAGQILLGEEVLTDWRDRNKSSTARVRGCFDVHPDERSAVSLDLSHRNNWGDPLQGSA